MPLQTKVEPFAPEGGATMAGQAIEKGSSAQLYSDCQSACRGP